MKKYQILLIDDDRNIIDGIEGVIQKAFPGRYEITCASDGREALLKLAERYYHLIISDIRMPGIDGIRLLGIIRKYGIPSTVIMLSGFDDYSYIRNAMKLGAYDYLLKPVDIEGFCGMLSAAEETYRDSMMTIPGDLESEAGEETKDSVYFNIFCPEAEACGREALMEKLELLSQAVLSFSEEEIKRRMDDIFSHLSPARIPEQELKNCLSDFHYALMQKNPALIRIIAGCKLTQNDLLAQIKSQPLLSKLKNRMTAILCLYVKELKTIQKDNEAYLVRKAKEYIDTHYTEQILLEDLARQCSLHPNYFSFLFKKQLGITVRDYILEKRIAVAQELMRDPRRKLLDIALATGYQDASHFNRAFKNVTGISPSQYRRGIEMDI